MAVQQSKSKVLIRFEGVQDSTNLLNNIVRDAAVPSRALLVDMSDAVIPVG